MNTRPSRVKPYVYSGNYILDASSERASLPDENRQWQPPWTGGQRLISVWDMKEYLAKRLVSISQNITHCYLISLEIDSAEFDKQRPTLERHLKKIEEELGFLGLRMTLTSTQRALSEVKKMTSEQLTDAVGDIEQRFLDEIAPLRFFYLNPKTNQYFETPLAGWGEVITAFPSTIYDIEEAGKCLALERSTSAAFHLMRVFGAGVKALGKSLNEPTLDKLHNLTWDNVLSRCTKELSEKYAGKSPEWQKHKEFYAAATTTLYGVKDAWRNPNAHEVGQKYTPEEASDIYGATRTFMRQLAKQLSENP